MGRIILGIVGGVLVASVVIGLIEFVGAAVFPRTAPTDWVEQVAVDDWVAAVPIAAKLIVVFGWFTGALAGTYAAARIARRPAIGWVPAALVAAAGIANITMIPHPLWMSIAAVAAPLLGGWISTRLARARPQPVMPAEAGIHRSRR